LQYIRGEPGHFVIGAAQLEGKNPLHVLSFEQYAVMDTSR